VDDEATELLRKEETLQPPGSDVDVHK
jgi:hypothetical protein